MTGDFAALSGLDNLKNAFTKVYQSRYVSGVVAGMKLAETDRATAPSPPRSSPNSFDADGNVKIGYVGAYNYAEVVSGYTAFFLGVRSIVPNVTMEVMYTNSWFDIDKEGAAAEALVAKGCVIIGQHADSTGAPAAVQKLQDAGTDLLLHRLQHRHAPDRPYRCSDLCDQRLVRVLQGAVRGRNAQRRRNRFRLGEGL